jgi:hypothetical protein
MTLAQAVDEMDLKMNNNLNNTINAFQDYITQLEKIENDVQVSLQRDIEALNKKKEAVAMITLQAKKQKRELKAVETQFKADLENLQLLKSNLLGILQFPKSARKCLRTCVTDTNLMKSQQGPKHKFSILQLSSRMDTASI